MTPPIKWWPAPEAGDIVWCHFPQIPRILGPKPRPALVCAVDDSNADEVLIKVAYGTSQKTNQLYTGEFLIASTNKVAYDLAGLSYDTKFDLKKMHLLPYNSQWFDVAPNSPIQTPVLGTLHSSLMKAINAAYQAMGGKRVGKGITGALLAEELIRSSNIPVLLVHGKES